MQGLKKTTTARLEDYLRRTVSEMFDEAVSRTRGAAEEVKDTVVGTVNAAATEVDTPLARVEDHVYIVAFATFTLGFALGLIAHAIGSKLPANSIRKPGKLTKVSQWTKR
jgi:hypothetical protein